MKKKKDSNSAESKVAELYGMMKDHKLQELEVKDNDFHIHIKRKSNTAKKVSQVRYEEPDEKTYTVPGGADLPEAKAVPPVSGDTLKSPIIGMFYRAPSPSSPTFVNEGDVVNAGKTLCIVEAMKVMNEIKADCKMKVVKILVENGSPVTADENLFIVEKV